MVDALGLIGIAFLSFQVESLFLRFKRKLIVRGIQSADPSILTLAMPVWVPLIEGLFFTAVTGWWAEMFLSGSWLRFAAYAIAFYFSTIMSIRPIVEVEISSDKFRRWESGKPLPMHRGDPNRILFSEMGGNVAVWIAWAAFGVGAFVFWYLIW